MIYTVIQKSLIGKSTANRDAAYQRARELNAAALAEGNPSNPYAVCIESLSVEELRPFLGDKWAIARKTPGNLSRYTRCITQREYDQACLKAIENRVPRFSR